MRLLLTALTCVLATLGPVGVSHAASTRPTVTFIGDSASVTIGRDPAAMALLGRGIDLRFEAAVCRRLARTSCPDNGVRPPTALDLVLRDGEALGSTVVVAVGYNDPEDEFAAEVEEVVQALEGAGVARILWVTLRAVRRPHLPMNDAIREVAARHPSVAIVDWNELARTHPRWFAEDGIHLEASGALALAGLVRRTLGELGVAPRLPTLGIATRKLPGGRVGARYAVRLAATGGEPAYRWKRVGRLLPAGLRVASAGVITGVPRSSGRFRITLRATDAVGTVVERVFTLSIAR